MRVTVLLIAMIIAGCASVPTNPPKSSGIDRCDNGVIVVRKTGSRIRSSSNNVPHAAACLRSK